MGTITHSDTLYPHLLTMAGRERLVDEAYQVHDAVFSGMDRAAFRKMVLPESEHSSILLHRGKHGQAVGYCAVHLFQRRAAGREVKVLRGQAGLLKDYRGRNSNMPFLAGCMLRYWLRSPWRPMYFLGAMIHPSSFIQMHKYAAGMWPSPERGMEQPLARLAAELCGSFGMAAPAAERPFVVKLGILTRDSQTDRQFWLQHPRPAARYFVEHNPDYHEGHGLLAMAELSPAAILNGVWRYLRDRRRAAAERSRL